MTDPQDTADGLFEDRLAAEIARFGDRFAIVPVAQVIVQWHQSRRVPPPPPPMPADAGLTSTSEQLEASPASPPRSRRGRGGGSGSGAGAALPKGRRQIFVGQLRPSADALALPAAVEHILQAPRSVDSCDMIAGKNGSRYGFLNFRSDEHIEALLQLNRHVYITGASLIFALPPARIPGDKTLQNIVRLVQRSIAGLDTDRNPANTVVFDGARFGADVGGDDQQQSHHSAAPPPAYMPPAAQAIAGMPHHRPPAPHLMQGSAPFPGGFPSVPYHAPLMQGFGVPPPPPPWGQPLVDSNGTPLYPQHYPQLQAQHHHHHHHHQHLFAPPPPRLCEHNVESAWGHGHQPAPFFHHPLHSHHHHQQQQPAMAQAAAAAAAALAAPPALVPTAATMQSPVVQLQPPPMASMAPQYPHQRHQRHNPQHRRPTPPPTAARQ